MLTLRHRIVWTAGPAFALLAALGVLRLPDVFTRMQGVHEGVTLGLGCLLIGAALQLGGFGSLIRLVSIGGFILVTTPRRSCHRTRCRSRWRAPLGWHRIRRSSLGAAD